MRRYVDTATVADQLAVSQEWVRAHAAELGAIRIGGPRGPLRFEPDRVEAALERRRLAPSRPRRRPGPVRTGGVELLPMPGDG